MGFVPLAERPLGVRSVGQEIVLGGFDASPLQGVAGLGGVIGIFKQPQNGSFSHFPSPRNT